MVLVEISRSSLPAQRVRPCLPDLAIEPATGVDALDARIYCRDAATVSIAGAKGAENVDLGHHALPFEFNCVIIVAPALEQRSCQSVSNVRS